MNFMFPRDLGRSAVTRLTRGRPLHVSSVLVFITDHFTWRARKIMSREHHRRATLWYCKSRHFHITAHQHVIVLSQWANSRISLLFNVFSSPKGHVIFVNLDHGFSFPFQKCLLSL